MKLKLESEELEQEVTSWECDKHEAVWQTYDRHHNYATNMLLMSQQYDKHVADITADIMAM